MSVLNQPPYVRVKSVEVQPRALHICRYPVEAPKPWDRALWLPDPLPDPARPGSLRGHGLYLPNATIGSTWPILSAEIDPTVGGLWVEMFGTPLAVPLVAEQQRRFDEDWRTAVFHTPSSLGASFSPTAFSRVGWAILARVPRDFLVGFLALTAQLFECRVTDPVLLERFVKLMAVPAVYRNRLLGRARAGHPILDPKALRWILAEVAAADEAELAQFASWRPSPGSEEELLVRALAPFLSTNSMPRLGHLRTALWLLHEGFHGSDGAFTSAEEILSGVTALGCATSPDGAWLSTLERWREIWSLPDDHRVVSGKPLAPSAVRLRYEKVLGVDPVRWLAGISFINLRWWGCFQEGALQNNFRFPVNPDELFVVGDGDDRIEFTPEFREAVTANFVAGIAELGTAVRASVADYRGLGTLPQTDCVALRNHPILKLPDGMWVPISLNLIGEKASVLHRWLLKSEFGTVQAVNSAVGPLFEGFIDDCLTSRIGHNHRIFSEAEITAVLGDAKRCDLAVAWGTDWLFIETSIQTLRRNVVTGNVTAIDALCDRYHDEADQAEATAARAAEIASFYGLPKPTSTAIVVVVDNSAPHSPALAGRLHQRRPGRNPRFVVSAVEMEALADLCSLGWSMPTAIRRWQTQPVEGPLSVVTAELARLIRPKMDRSPEQTRAWWDDLPRTAPKAAA